MIQYHFTFWNFFPDVYGEAALKKTALAKFQNDHVKGEVQNETEKVT